MSELQINEVTNVTFSFTESPTTDPVKVLAVDDDSSLLDLTATFLERERDSFEVVTETRPDEALTLLQESHTSVDAVVSDYDMPSMNGLEFLEAVREEYPNLPFVLFTGKGNEEIASEAISAGVTDYLQKGAGASTYSVLSNRVLNAVEKYRTQNELKASERKFSKLVENSSDMIAIVSDDGRFEYVSPSCEHLIGYEQEELIGDSVFNFVDPEDRQYVMEQFFEAIENPSMTPVVEFRLNNPEYDEKVLESRGTNLLEDEVVDGFVVNTRDITDLNKRERDLRQRNEQLESIKDLISHDIRNPLNVAFGSVELYHETGSDKHIESVQKALERIDTLIDQTNLLADQPVRIEDADTIPLGQVVRAAWEMVDTKDATLLIDDSRRIEGDPDRLQQLFENLINNAVTHGGRETTCAVGTMEDAIYFEDDGAGIPESDEELVFKSGFTTGENNTGLGLTIIDHIVSGHDWEIGVTNGEDGGARFEITGVSFQPTVYE